MVDQFIVTEYVFALFLFFLMRFTADLHTHTDVGHGDHPKNVAQGVVSSGVDVYAITEHRHPSDRAFDVQNEVESILDGSGRKVLGLIGVEVNLSFGGGMYHSGHIFENLNLRRGQLPEDPKRILTLEEFQAYKKAYPGVSIFFHPTWHDGKSHKRRNNPDETKDLMKSGLFQGVELLNGLLLTNGAPIDVTESAMEMFLQSRRRGVRLAAIGCSDAHRGVGGSSEAANYVGTSKTEFCHESPRGIFEAIRIGNTKAVAVDQEVRRKVNILMRKVPGAGRYLKMGDDRRRSV